MEYDKNKKSWIGNDDGFPIFWNLKFPISDFHECLKLCHEIDKRTYDHKKNRENHRCLMKNFFWSTTFKFSKVIGIRDNRESRTFCLDHDKSNQEDGDYSKKSMHKFMSKKPRILYKVFLFLQILLFFGFFDNLWYTYLKLIFSSMKSLFFWILLSLWMSLVFLFWFDLYANCSESDMTSESFCIDVGGISPVDNGGGANVSGSWALLKFLESLSNLLLVLVPMLAWVSGIVAGYYYIFSSGSSEKSWLAKNIIKYNIIAIFVALGSYGIIALVASFLNA